MAWRTTEEDVRQIIDNVTTNSMKPFIETANALTDHVDSKDADNELSDAMLVEIEKYLAAHFYAHLDQPFQANATEAASATYQGQFAMGLDSTRWGQTAKRLDFTGTLAEMDRTKHRVSLKWVGLPPSEQTDYEDRD